MSLSVPSTVNQKVEEAISRLFSREYPTARLDLGSSELAYIRALVKGDRLRNQMRRDTIVGLNKVHSEKQIELGVT